MMTVLLICAAVVVAVLGLLSFAKAGRCLPIRYDEPARFGFATLGLSLIAAALYLAWRAGGAG